MVSSPPDAMRGTSCSSGTVLNLAYARASTMARPCSKSISYSSPRASEIEELENSRRLVCLSDASELQQVVAMEVSRHWQAGSFISCHW